MKKVVFAVVVLLINHQAVLLSAELTPVARAFQERQEAGDPTFYSMLQYVCAAGDAFELSAGRMIFDEGGVVVSRSTFEDDLAAALSYSSFALENGKLDVALHLFQLVPALLWYAAYFCSYPTRSEGEKLVGLLHQLVVKVFRLEAALSLEQCRAGIAAIIKAKKKICIKFEPDDIHVSYAGMVMLRHLRLVADCYVDGYAGSALADDLWRAVDPSPAGGE